MEVYAAALILMSAVSFALYGIDKRKAIKGKWRIRESTLLISGIFFGGAGAVLGMEVFHHKVRRWYFWAVNLLSLCAQLVLLWMLF